MEMKIINNEIKGSIIKVVTSSYNDDTQIRATYMPYLQVVKPFKLDQSNNDQITFDERPYQDGDAEEDETPIVDCQDDNELIGCDICMIDLTEDQGEIEEDEDSIPSLEDMFTEKEENKEDKEVNKIFSPFATIDLGDEKKKKHDKREHAQAVVRPKTRKIGHFQEGKGPKSEYAMEEASREENEEIKMQ